MRGSWILARDGNQSGYMERKGLTLQRRKAGFRVEEEGKQRQPP